MKFTQYIFKLSHFGLISFCCLFFSCAKTKDQVCEDAKLEANILATKRDCTKALNAIQNACSSSDGEYVGLLASIEACNSGYSELTFLENDVSSIDPARLIVSLASLSTSNETGPSSTTYEALRSATQRIINSTPAGPGAAERLTYFGEVQATDLNFQLLFMLIVQMGKYFAFYGNADAGGVKGAGALPNNTCLYSYDNADAVNWVTSNPTGSCTSATGIEGSSSLEAPESIATIKSRLCEGVILFNNFTDTIKNLNFSGDIYGDLSQIGDAIDTVYTNMIDAENLAYSTNSIERLKDILAQNECLEQDINDIQKYFAIFFESLYQ